MPKTASTRAPTGWWASCLLAGGLLAAAGCSNSGSYTLKWQFAQNADMTADFVPGDCGRVGVTGMQIAATGSDGSQQSAIAVPCGLGFFDGSIGAGSWTLHLVALDATGHPKETLPGSTLLSGQTASAVEIQAGEQAAPIPPVFLEPLPRCRDGVDNDLDGRVDLDDSDCAGDPEGPSECGASDGPSCSDNPPGGNPNPDGGSTDADGGSTGP